VRQPATLGGKTEESTRPGILIVAGHFYGKPERPWITIWSLPLTAVTRLCRLPDYAVCDGFWLSPPGFDDS